MRGQGHRDQGGGRKRTLPAVVPEPLPALLAHPATVEQIQMALAGVQDQLALVHQYAAEVDPSHASGTCMCTMT